MFNLSEPYSGHFFTAQWVPWDEENKTYKPSISIKIKGQSEIGVSTGVKEQIIERVEGRIIKKNVFRVNVVENHPYKIRDKIIFPQENITYVIHKVSDNINHPNGIVSLMFKQSLNVPKTLYLGE
jgi:hypothetical protein